MSPSGILGSAPAEPHQYGPLAAIVAFALLGWLAGACESAMQSMSRSRLDDLLEKRGRQRGFFLANILDNLESFRFSTAFVSGVGYALFVLYGYCVWARPHETGTLTLWQGAVLVAIMATLRGIGEMTGELLAERLIIALAGPIWVVTLLLSWLTRAGFGLYRMLVRGAGYDLEKTQEDLEDEVIAAVSDGELAGVVNEDQRQMIERVFDFEHTDVADIFTPRTEMETLDINTPLSEAIEKGLRCGHSRLPVHENTLDNVVGIFYLRDALNYWKQEKRPSLRELMHKPLFVPETKNVTELLALMRKSHTQIAIVLDEYGGTAGLVTIEDALEEIVGDIQDEYDGQEEDYFVKTLEPGHVLADGQVHVADVNKALDLDVIPEDEDYETIGGFVLYILGHIPKAGEEFTHGRVTVKILAADERRVKRVEVRAAPG